MKNILTKLLTIAKEVPKMEKDGTNTLQNYKYLSETQVKETMRELLCKHGVVFVQSSTQKALTQIGTTKAGAANWMTSMRVDYKFYDAESGEFVEGWYEADGVDTQDKGAYKAVTGAVKNIFMNNFLIPTGNDPENDSKAAKKSYANSPSQSQKPVAKKENGPALNWNKEEVTEILNSGIWELKTGVGQSSGKPWYMLVTASQRGFITEQTYNYIKDSKGTKSQSVAAEEVFN